VPTTSGEYLDINTALLQALSVKFPDHARAGDVSTRLAEAATVFEQEADADGQLDLNGVWRSLENLGVFTARSTVKVHMSEADSKVRWRC